MARTCLASASMVSAFCHFSQFCTFTLQKSFTADSNLDQFPQIAGFALVFPSPVPFGNIASVILLFCCIERAWSRMWACQRQIGSSKYPQLLPCDPAVDFITFCRYLMIPFESARDELPKKQNESKTD